MRTSLAFLIALLAAFPDPARAAQPSEPLQNFLDVPVKTRSGQPSLSQVREAIITARAFGGGYWQMQETEPGRLLATLRWRTHVAEIAITYGPDRYSIVYRDSSNLGYEAGGPSIHPNYNRLVRELAFRIASALSTTDGDPTLVIPPRGSRAAPVVVAPAGLDPQDASDAIAVRVSADPAIRQSRAWPVLVAEWQNHMPAAIDAVDATLLTVREGEPEALGQPGTLVAVRVNRFRYVSPARPYTRSPAFQGRPTNATLEVDVQFFDLKTGAPIGKARDYAMSAYSHGAQSTNLQVRDLAQQIMTDWRREIATVTAPAAQADRAELSFWQSVRDTTNPDELQAYLDAYPKGVFTPIARARLAELRAARR